MYHEFPFVVKVRYLDERKGLKSEPFDDETEAKNRAKALVHDPSFSDVVIISNTTEVVIEKVKGEIWFLLRELNTHFPGRWRLSDAPPLPDASDEVLRRDQINERILAQMEQEEAQREEARKGSSVQVSEA